MSVCVDKQVILEGKSKKMYSNTDCIIQLVENSKGHFLLFCGSFSLNPCEELVPTFYRKRTHELQRNSEYRNIVRKFRKFPQEFSSKSTHL